MSINEEDLTNNLLVLYYSFIKQFSSFADKAINTEILILIILHII